MSTPVVTVALARRFRLGGGAGPVFTIAVAVLVVVSSLALLADIVAPADPLAVNLSATLAGPGAEYLLGADLSGRDTLSRLIHGARASLLGPFTVVVASSVAGVVLGSWSAWRGGLVDVALSRSLEIVFAFPGLLLAILAVAVVGPGLTAPVVAMTVAYTPYIARLTRSAMLQEAAKPYVAAYRVQGFSAWSIAVRHVLPNILPVILAQATLNFGYALMDLAALSYLGFGVQPPTPDWGTMIKEGQPAILEGAMLPAVVPGICIVVVVVAFTLVGEGIADRVARRENR
ncbi:MAG: ABC transporter permease [Actinomycetota bacterium]|nr:ABC transporter permease [Actinomycetota bacterium]